MCLIYLLLRILIQHKNLQESPNRNTLLLCIVPNHSTRHYNLFIIETLITNFFVVCC